MKKTALVGVHHKTGTALAIEIVKLISDAGPLKWETAERPVTSIPNHYRKLPISRTLQLVPKAKIVVNMWFEHEIDKSDIAFLHFVRNPLVRITSAYLYHRRGAPNDPVRWVDWAIFDFHGQKKSYREILNELRFADGVLVEAIRTYPEAIGSARAFRSSLSLPAEDRLTVWLDEFEEDPTQSLEAIFDLFFDNDPDRLSLFLLQSKSKNIVLDPHSAANRDGHVTKADHNRQVVEELIVNSPEINCLYGAVMEDMNIPLTQPGPQLGSPTFDLLNEINLNRKYLMVHPEIASLDPNFWSDRNTGNFWQTLTLSNFGCGHLMMYPFIQKFIANLT